MPSVKGRCDPVPASCKFLRIWRYPAENGPQIPGGALAGFPPGWYTEARMKRTAENPLLHLENFIAAPHLGANTEEALKNVGMAVVRELLERLDIQTNE